MVIVGLSSVTKVWTLSKWAVMGLSAAHLQSLLRWFTNTSHSPKGLYCRLFQTFNLHFFIFNVQFAHMRPASSYFSSALQFYKTVAVIDLSHKLLTMLAVCPRWTLFKGELWEELAHPQGDLGRNLVCGGCQGGLSQDRMMQALRRMTSVRALSKHSLKISSDLSRDSSFRLGWQNYNKPKRHIVL